MAKYRLIILLFVLGVICNVFQISLGSKSRKGNMSKTFDTYTVNVSYIDVLNGIVPINNSTFCTWISMVRISDFNRIFITLSILIQLFI